MASINGSVGRHTDIIAEGFTAPMVDLRYEGSVFVK